MSSAGRGPSQSCRVLYEQGLPVAPRTYRVWKANTTSARTLDDAGVVDQLRHLKIGGPRRAPLPEVLSTASALLQPRRWRQRPGKIRRQRNIFRPHPADMKTFISSVGAVSAAIAVYEDFYYQYTGEVYT